MIHINIFKVSERKALTLDFEENQEKQDDFLSRKIQMMKNTAKNKIKSRVERKSVQKIPKKLIIENPIKDIEIEYKIGKIIGEGSFSVVRKLVRKSDNKEFALKQFKKGKAWPTARGEARILQELSHPKIIKFQRFYELNGKVKKFQ